MPSTDIILFSDEALDELSQEIYKFLFLVESEVWLFNEGEQTNYRINLFDFSDLVCKGRAFFIHHLVFIHSCQLAYNI